MKRSTRFTLVGLLLVGALVLTPLLGGVAHARGKKPAELKLFKESCKACHSRGDEAGNLAPLTLISMQWKRFFDKKYAKTHADLVHPETQKPLKEMLDEETLKKLKRFLMDHAADSEHPMTCG